MDHADNTFNFGATYISNIPYRGIACLNNKAFAVWHCVQHGFGLLQNKSAKNLSYPRKAVTDESFFDEYNCLPESKLNEYCAKLEEKCWQILKLSGEKKSEQEGLLIGFDNFIESIRNNFNSIKEKLHVN